jgi:hypothetical protein
VSPAAERTIQNRLARPKKVYDLPGEHRRVICAIPVGTVNTGRRGGHTNRHVPVVPTPGTFATYFR